MPREVEVHSRLGAEERTAAQTVASAAVAAKLPVVAPWMVHPGCFGSAELSRESLFAQGLAPEGRPEERCRNFGPKWMKALW